MLSVWLSFLISVAVFSLSHSMSSERGSLERRSLENQQELNQKLHAFLETLDDQATTSKRTQSFPDQPKEIIENQELEVLLEAGADPNCRNITITTATPLRLATLKNRPELVKTLLQYGAHVNGTKDSKSFSTPLHLAAQRHSIPIISILLEEGADVEAHTKGGQSALAWALSTMPSSTHERIIKNQAVTILLAHNVPIPPTLPVATIFPSIFETDLLRWSAFGNLAAIKETEQQPPANNIHKSTDSFLRMAPVHWAAARGHAGVLSYLLEHDKSSCNLSDGRFNTPMDLAVRNKQENCIEILKQAGARCHIQFGLVAALHRRDAQAVTQLLSTLSPHAARNKYDYILLQYCDYEGNPPLHVAAAQPYTPFLDEILHAEANTYLRSRNGTTALKTALSNPCPGDLTYMCSEIIAPNLFFFSKIDIGCIDAPKVGSVAELRYHLAPFIAYSYLQESNPYKSHKARGRELFEAIKNLKLVAKPDLSQ
jgi:ankyrin repeat protein